MSISEEARSEELNNSEMEAQDSQRTTILRDSITANYGDSDIAMVSALEAYTRSEGIGGTVASWSHNDSILASLIVSLMQKVDDMTQEMRSLKEAVLSERVLSLEESGDEDESAIGVTKEEAKEMIAELFDEKGQLDYIEIMTTLDLDPELVIAICDELEADGKVEGVD